MKVKIEDFLLAMGDYCKEHDVGECCPENCRLSVDLGGRRIIKKNKGSVVFGCDYLKYTKMK